MARICWLEEAPAEDTAEWLYWKMRHAGQETLWEMVIAWVPQLSYSNVVTACQQCTVCTEKHPGQLPQDTGGL